MEVPTREESADYQWEVIINSRFRTASERFRSDYKALSRVLGEPFLVSSFSQDWLLRNAICTLASVEVQGPSEARAMIAGKCRQTLELYGNWAFPK